MVARTGAATSVLLFWHAPCSQHVHNVDRFAGVLSFHHSSYMLCYSSMHGIKGTRLELASVCHNLVHQVALGLIIV